MERDALCGVRFSLTRISTHTLTWSVTNRLNVTAALMEISTHTLTWSVTINRFSQGNNYNNFNSHAHVERDTESSPMAQHNKHFNSHAHVERDGGRGNAATAAIDFNSHAHVERDAHASSCI